jgi:GNAT superfamily N-acetyltransferase
VEIGPRNSLAGRAEPSDDQAMTTTPTATIRRSTPDDIGAVARVRVEGWRSGYRGIMPDAVLDDLRADELAERWRRTWIDADDAGTLVAEADGEVIGFVSVGAAEADETGGPRGELRALYLLEDRWGTGLGRALFDAGVEWLDRCHERPILWVLTDNHRARRFYERQGWRPDGEVGVFEVGDAQIPDLRYAAPQ